MTGPRLVKGASVADFATHLGGFGAHGAAISAGLGSVVPPKGSQNGTKRLQQRSMEREGGGVREIQGFGGRFKIDLKIVAPKPKMEPRFGLEMRVGRSRAA